MGIDFNLQKMLADACQGNPGAFKVLIDIYKDEPKLAAGIMAKAILTDTHAACFWLIYKDECQGDLGRTKTMLDNWLSSRKGTDSLGEWIIEKGLKSAPEARYYLKKEEQPHANR